MKAAHVPRSLSVYRGQTRRGIGEGPGSAVPQGEQYIDAAGELRDARLLREIRPWMTLDSDPAHHRKLSDRLEAWSVFPSGGRLFVARLSSAGAYMQRVAYFTHGRAWPEPECRNGFDPGVLLGNAAAFDRPWRDRDPGGYAPPEIPDDAAKVKEPDSPSVARFLAFLLQGMAERRPVVIAAPLQEFAEGGPLPARLGLARAALPMAFKRRCRLRIYTQTPELFLGALHADLVVVPADSRGDATAVRGDAIVLDENGQCRNGPPDPRAAGYAQAVLSQVERTPGGLLPFSERFSSRHHPEDDRLPDDGELLYIQVVYYLAYGLAGSEKRHGALLDFLFKTAQQSDLPWSKLIGDQEWARLPCHELARFLLRTDGERPERRRALQAAAENALRQTSDEAFLGSLRATLTEQLTDWWSSDDKAQKERIVRLLEARLLEESAASRYLSQIPAELADHARRHPEEVRDLARKTSAGELDPAWAEPLLRDEDSSQGWLRLVEHLLSSPGKWTRWGRIPHQILDRLLERPPDSPEIAAFVQKAGDLVKDDADVEILIRLAEIQHRMGGGRASLLLKTREKIRWLERRDLQGKVLEYVLSDEWQSLPRSLAVSDSSLRELPWLDQHEDRLLEHPDARKDLSTERLLRLSTQVGEERLRQLFGEIDTRMARDASEATRALVRTGWWPYWRRLSRTASPSGAALAWLSCDAWQEPGTPDATYEAWVQALEDAARLSADQVRRLCDGGTPRWPWIPPFEEEQVAGLGALCQDVDALAALIQGFAASPRAADLEASPAVLATLTVDLDALGLGPRFDADGLLWLIDERLRGGREAPVLPLEASRRLYERTELCREQGALPARIVSVLAHLDRDPWKALEASERPDLWPDERFLTRLAAWLSSHQGIAELGGGGVAGVRVARAIEKRLPTSAKCSTGDVSARLLGELKENGCEKTRRFLRERSPEEETADRLIDAICRNDTEDAIWEELTHAVDHRRRDKDHPLAVLAGVIQGMSLTPEQRSLLEKNSWPTVDTVASQASHPSTFFGSGYDNEPLPLFELIRSLRFAGSPGDIAAGIAAAAGSARYRKAAAWWKRLLLGFGPSQTGFERLEDDPVRALHLVELCVENLSAPEQCAWRQACTELPTNPSAFNHGDVS